jgi:hypothetical protein
MLTSRKMNNLALDQAKEENLSTHDPSTSTWQSTIDSSNAVKEEKVSFQPSRETKDDFGLHLRCRLVTL